MVTRDRSSVYACAITNACPGAVQVADRWHLLANLSEAVERFLDSQRAAINDSIMATLPSTDIPDSVQPLSEDQLPPFLTWENDRSQLGAITQTGCRSKRYVMYQKVKQLQAEGHSMRAIARHLGMAASAVRQKHRKLLLAPRSICAPPNPKALKSTTL